MVVMAKKKVEQKVYELKDNKIIMLEADIPKLTQEDKDKISFYHNVLGHEMCFIQPEEKVKEYFRLAAAKKYLKKRDKAGLAEFEKIAAKADKAAAAYKTLKAAEKAAAADGATEEDKKAAPTPEALAAAQKDMISEQREAFKKQRAWFKEKYGEEAYDEVRKMGK